MVKEGAFRAGPLRALARGAGVLDDRRGRGRWSGWVWRRFWGIWKQEWHALSQKQIKLLGSLTKFILNFSKRESNHKNVSNNDWSFRKTIIFQRNLRCISICFSSPVTWHKFSEITCWCIVDGIVGAQRLVKVDARFAQGHWRKEEITSTKFVLQHVIEWHFPLQCFQIGR